MAERDIMPWRSAGGGPGGTVKGATYHLHPNRTYLTGEVLVLTEANGQLALAGHNPDVSNHTDAGGAGVAGSVGIAAEPAEGFSSVGTGVTNPEWGSRNVWIFTPEQEWITLNYTDGIVTAEFTWDAIHSDVGDEVGICLNTFGGGSRWGISNNADTTNLMFRITDVLDSNKVSIKDATTEATWVVFRLSSAHQPNLVVEQ